MIPQYVKIQSTEHGHQTKEQIKTMQCRTLNRLYVNLNTDFKDAYIYQIYIFLALSLLFQSKDEPKQNWQEAS